MTPPLLLQKTLSPALPAEDLPDPEALIEEARQRQRRRRRGVAAVALAIICAGVLVYLALARTTSHHAATGEAPSAAAAARRCPGVNLGTVAFVRGAALATVDFLHCQTRIIVRSHVVGPVQFSRDGRYVSFTGGYVAVADGIVHHTRGAGVWSPRSNVLAAPHGTSGVELIEPGHAPRVLLPTGWGATTFRFSPDGRTLAVSRSLYHSPTIPPPYHQELWLIDLASGHRRMIFRQPNNALGQPWIADYSPDGRWLLFWEDTQNSASLAADGLPLLAIRTTGGKPIGITNTLRYRNYLTWCGNTLVFVTNHGGRLVTDGDGIAAASAPDWKTRTILPVAGNVSWNSVACTGAGAVPDGGLAVVAGPSLGGDMSGPFGHERSIWLTSPTTGATPQRLTPTTPPPGLTDELPMWSKGGQWIVFTRTKPGGVGGVGSLYAIRPSDQRLVGPIAHIGGTSNYYGSYAWAYKVDWHRER